jgi:Raf kinase inhibitor-like YbhB/YbcL family protein
VKTSNARRRIREIMTGAAVGAIIAGSAVAQTGERADSKTVERPQHTSTMKIQLNSEAFSEGQPIPAKYTGDGEDISPPLRWSSPPPGTKSFALICDDPDAPAGTWVHWVVYDLPASTTLLPAKLPPDEILPDGTRQGITDFKKVGYGGPYPPPGKPHRYFFKLYALDTALALKPRATKQQLLKAMQGHILAETSLMGVYQRGR